MEIKFEDGLFSFIFGKPPFLFLKEDLTGAVVG